MCKVSCSVIEYIVVFIWFKVIDLIIIYLGNILWFLKFWFQLSTLFLTWKECIINLSHWTIHILMLIQIRPWLNIALIKLNINLTIPWNCSICANSFLLSNFLIHTQASTYLMMIGSISNTFDGWEFLFVYSTLRRSYYFTGAVLFVSMHSCCSHYPLCIIWQTIFGISVYLSFTFFNFMFLPWR